MDGSLRNIQPLKVWVAFPSANPDRARETLAKWHERGYLSAVLLNRGDGTDGEGLSCGANATITHVQYDGFYRAGNVLSQWLVSKYGADVVVCANDDIDPDPNKTAREIAEECVMHAAARSESEGLRASDALGADPSLWIMQPTGDRQGWMIDKRHPEGGTAAADRICGSPWFSAAYIRRGYGGRGPWPTEYHHFGGDVEMKEVAEQLGILWQRRDLTHLHRHHSWGHTEKMPYQKATQGHWAMDENILRQRREHHFFGAGVADA